jgi:uncharacterized protein (DUF885 family)
LLARGAIQTALRGWFDSQGFVEVDPAILQVSPGNEAHLHAFATEAVGHGGERTPLYLRTSPEFASSIGDNRYNDQLSDYSVKAYNDQVARGRAYLTRLSEVDTTGLSDQEKLSAALMIRQLVNEQDEARFKTWLFTPGKPTSW